MELKYLFSPLETPKLRLKNRIVMLASTLHYTENGLVNERIIDFFRARAKGGVGLIIVGGCGVDEYAAGKDFLTLESDVCLPQMTNLTGAVHQDGAKIAAQLFHGGRYVHSQRIGGRQPRSASSVTASHFGHDNPREMTHEEIEETVGNFASAAGRAKAAGFDAVEIIGSQGYLVNQFLSPTSNKRNDEYGGSFENRLRFPLEVIRRIRQEVGESFPIIMRLCADEFIPGGLGIEDTKRVAKVYEESGVDIIDIQIAWHESKVPSVYMHVPRGAFVYLAQAIKQAVKIPVIAVNRINDPLLAEDMLRQGKADLIGMSRALIADPDWPNKAAQGRFEDICYCTGCTEGCLAFMPNGERPAVTCTVNPAAGKESLFAIKPASKPKKVAVIGGGPAGLEASRVLALRGHRVTLFEKRPELGGSLRLASLVPGKSEFGQFIKYQTTQLEKLKVRIMNCTEVNPDLIRNEGFQTVVVATGAEPAVPEIPGVDSGNVVCLEDVLNGTAVPGKRVVILGAGGAGCDTAMFVAREGRLDSESIIFLLSNGAVNAQQAIALSKGNREVTLVEKLDNIANGVPRQVRWVVLQELKMLGVNMLTGADCQQITSEGIWLTQAGERKFIPADTVVIATGGHPNTGLYSALKGIVPEIYLIGDGQQVGRCLKAVAEGAEAARLV